MVIDMHTHIWPEKIAKKTVRTLERIGGIHAYSGGTLTELKHTMKEDGVDLSVILPVITKPEQFDTVNRVAATYRESDGIISFGAIHPKNTEYIEKLKWIRELGLKGIKIHPDYQEEYFSAPSYQAIINEALSLGLIVTTHAGVDVGLSEPVHCTPSHVAAVYEALRLGDNVDNKLVLAHTGGCDLWEEVLETLAGKKLYFDISFTHGRIADELFLALVRKHGSKRMMFGTDYPWSSAAETIAWMKSLPLTKEEREDILYRTAEQLLFSN